MAWTMLQDLAGYEEWARAKRVTDLRGALAEAEEFERELARKYGPLPVPAAKRGGPISEKTLKMLERAVGLMTPAGKRELRRLVERLDRMDRPCVPAYKWATLPLQHKSLSCLMKSGPSGDSVTFYPAIFGNIDRGGDVIAPGAVRNTDEFLKDGVILLNHNTNDPPIGYPVAASQDSRGFRVEFEWHSTPAAQAVRTYVEERIRASKSVQASIGYTVDDASYEMRGGQQVRLLKAINIYECSIVNIAMNPLAGVV